MRVAQDNLGTHIYQLVDEEQTALEHLLMYQYRAASLSSHHDETERRSGVSPGHGASAKVRMVPSMNESTM